MSALHAVRFDQPHARAARLHALDLTEELVADALVIGLLKQRACTPLHPGNFAEIVEWGETVYGLRTLLLPRGWEADEKGGLSRVVNHRLGIALVVATGCSNTGRHDRETEPRTKNKKGREAGIAIHDNGQLSLLASPEEDAPESPQESTLKTWYVLFSNDQKRIWFEVSLPKGRDGAGRIVSWYERIVCDSLEIEKLVAQRQQTADVAAQVGDDSTEIDVSVERIH